LGGGTVYHCRREVSRADILGIIPYFQIPSVERKEYNADGTIRGAFKFSDFPRVINERRGGFSGRKPQLGLTSAKSETWA
jgi:hypothetical protein